MGQESTNKFLTGRSVVGGRKKKKLDRGENKSFQVITGSL